MRAIGFVFLLPAVLVAAITVIVLASCSLLGGNQQGRVDSFHQQCVTADGHIYGSGLILCLTTDGRIIEVYP